MSQTPHDAWHALQSHAKHPILHGIAKQTLKPSSDFQLTTEHLTLDYSHQRITPHTLPLLCCLANACDLQTHIRALMHGMPVNVTESRPALHTALRAPSHSTLYLDGHNIMQDIADTKATMASIAQKLRAGEWLGYTGKPIKHIVHLGVGGSSLGPDFSLQALKQFTTPTLSFHVLSEVDPLALEYSLAPLDPEVTLFIVVSKSFTTEETLHNASLAIQWIGQQHIEHHFIAVTHNIEKAHAVGIQTVLPLWDWVGGRFSFCSAGNLVTAIAIGMDAFNDMLQAAHHMDQHFSHAPFEQNMPVLLALLGIWNNNLLGIHNLLILTYGTPLEPFTRLVQQLEMESNGKRTNPEGKTVPYATAPIIWGSSGITARHSYYQLLSQGTHQITADLISIDTYHKALCNQSSLAKVQCLTQAEDASHPSMALNQIRLHRLSPESVGQLVTLYEHKVYTQSVIWGLNAFDQPGVEATKQALAALCDAE